MNSHEWGSNPQPLVPLRYDGPRDKIYILNESIELNKNVDQLILYTP